MRHVHVACGICMCMCICMLHLCACACACTCACCICVHVHVHVHVHVLRCWTLSLHNERLLSSGRLPHFRSASLPLCATLTSRVASALAATSSRRRSPTAATGPLCQHATRSARRVLWRTGSLRSTATCSCCCRSCIPTCTRAASSSTFCHARTYTGSKCSLPQRARRPTHPARPSLSTVERALARSALARVTSQH